MHVRRHLLLVSVIQTRGTGPLGGQLDHQDRGWGWGPAPTRQGREAPGTVRRSPWPRPPAGPARCFGDDWMSRVCSVRSAGSPGSQPRARATAAAFVGHAGGRARAMAGLSRTSFMAEAVRTPNEPPIRFIDELGPDGVADLRGDGDLQAARGQQRREGVQPVVGSAVRAADDQSVTCVLGADHPGRDDAAGGVGDRADGALRTDVLPQRPCGSSRGRWVPSRDRRGSGSTTRGCRS